MNVREKTASEKRLIDYYYLAEKIECPGQPLVYWDDIEAAPTVDAVEVVRCWECKYHEDTHVIGFEHCCLYDLIMRYNDFCSYGKREGGSDND